MEYKKTLNLPVTDFPMKASLTAMEPRVLERWYADDLYGKIQQRNQKNPLKFLLHDGPPYANGHVHLGTALNKILKDFIVKSRTMMGAAAPYVPGWDCHGMPIEHNVVKELGEQGRSLSKLEIRRRCREYALGFVDIQREEFKRLGCLGDWPNPYITMSHDYEAETVGALQDLVEGGYVYKGLRPIHWCATCRTALAEAELEYHEHTSPSIFVGFQVRDNDPVAAKLGVPTQGHSILIWTTTPWTIPANLAIALHPEFDYLWVQVGAETFLVAEKLLPSIQKSVGWMDPKVIGQRKGAELEGLRCRHPMFDRDSVLILADYVTLDAGTGCVHTAPGHGAEDYESGKKYSLEIFSPVDEGGCFTAQVPGYVGVSVFAANAKIIEQLAGDGMLLGKEQITHSYPFCWRCKQPLIFRATEQWFVSVDANDLRKRALAEISRVSWIPKWGEQRIFNMVQSRPDWGLSRQRSWGVPIPAVDCLECGTATLDPRVIARFRDQVREKGTDVWYEEPVERFLPEGFVCPHCKNSKQFRRGEDILDVWFDSSVSQRAVLEHHPDLSWPCDLYLEATDQHRGWFQVSLLTAVGTRGAAPYRAVLTHGLILDESCKKMSKSLGNVIKPQEVIDKFGADVLRLLFASVDYTADISFSGKMLGPMAEAYRKIRNTIRFMLGNLRDFDPQTQQLPEASLEELDRWMLARLREVSRRVREAYEQYQFHLVYHTLLDLCTVELSAFYLDVIKDRLYVTGATDASRRSAQTVLCRLTTDLLAMLAPILSFTAEEAWGYLPPLADRPASVHLGGLPELAEAVGDKEILERWARFRKVRAELNKALDVACKAGVARSGLDAHVQVQAGAELASFLLSFGKDLLDLVKVAALEFVPAIIDPTLDSPEFQGMKVKVTASPVQKCARCWNRRGDVGIHSAHPDLCGRCADVLSRMAAHC